MSGDPIAQLSGVLLSRGVPSAEVTALSAKLRRLAQAGLVPTVDLPQYGLSVALSAAGRRKRQYRPGGRVE